MRNYKSWFLKLFSDDHFENGVYEVTYSLIFIDNIQFVQKYVSSVRIYLCRPPTCMHLEANITNLL